MVSWIGLVVFTVWVTGVCWTLGYRAGEKDAKLSPYSKDIYLPEEIGYAAYSSCRQVPIKMGWALAQDGDWYLEGSWTQSDEEILEAVSKKLQSRNSSPVVAVGLATFDLWMSREYKVHVAARLRGLKHIETPPVLEKQAGEPRIPEAQKS